MSAPWACPVHAVAAAKTTTLNCISSVARSYLITDRRIPVSSQPALILFTTAGIEFSDTRPAVLQTAHDAMRYAPS